MMGQQKAFTFIKQSEAAFGHKIFLEASKIWSVRLYLKDAATNWWLKLVDEGKEPMTWAELKVSFNKKFLPNKLS